MQWLCRRSRLRPRQVPCVDLILVREDVRERADAMSKTAATFRSDAVDARALKPASKRRGWPLDESEIDGN